ncbi:MAG: 3-isopropylmalate dehydrogenase [Firmicutes bacterium]|nr:3-isopropylmalate dehydrogenase [Bacillota bacterium]
MKKTIAVLRGDGIGPEIIDAALMVLGAIEQRFSHQFNYHSLAIGGEALDKTGAPLPEDTLEGCKKADAALLGAVGGPKWEKNAPHLRPEKALLALRQGLNVFANLRPAVLFDSLVSSSPLRADIAKKGINMMIVRELTGGIYFGKRGYRDGPFGQEAFDTEIYSIMEVERIAKLAFDIASRRERKKLVSVDKANVLDSSKLWRKTVDKIAQLYPDIQCEHMLVDNCAMQLVRDPSQFDVLLMPNMFGDILSDEASAITGSIGLLPSSSIGSGKFGLYEPIHGSAPDIAGKNIANPIGTILSAGMMLSNSFGLHKEAKTIDNAVKAVLAKGLKTADLGGKTSCSKMAEEISLQALTV